MRFSRSMESNIPQTVQSINSILASFSCILPKEMVIALCPITIPCQLTSSPPNEFIAQRLFQEETKVEEFKRTYSANMMCHAHWRDLVPPEKFKHVHRDQYLRGDNQNITHSYSARVLYRTSYHGAVERARAKCDRQERVNLQAPNQYIHI